MFQINLQSTSLGVTLESWLERGELAAWQVQPAWGLRLWAWLCRQDLPRRHERSSHAARARASNDVDCLEPGLAELHQVRVRSDWSARGAIAAAMVVLGVQGELGAMHWMNLEGLRRWGERISAPRVRVPLGREPGLQGSLNWNSVPNQPAVHIIRVRA